MTKLSLLLTAKMTVTIPHEIIPMMVAAWKILRVTLRLKIIISTAGMNEAMVIRKHGSGVRSHLAMSISAPFPVITPNDQNPPKSIRFDIIGATAPMTKQAYIMRVQFSMKPSIGLNILLMNV